MPRQAKYDRVALKQEFFNSNYDEIKAFLGEKWVSYTSWWIAKKTKWWVREKKEYQNKILEKALLRQQSKLAKQLEVPAELCLANIKKSIELSALKLEQMEEKQNINTKDLSNIRAMNRIQNNMPTTFVKSENENMNTERIEAIHIILWPNPIDSKEKH